MTKDREGVQRAVLVRFPHRDNDDHRLRHARAAGQRRRRRPGGRVRADRAQPDLGLHEIVPVADLIPTEWTIEEAMRFVVSAGTAGPERIAYEKNSRA